MTAEQSGFASWAVLELFGHQRIAGQVTEVPLAGTSFLRVDVPETAHREAYSRIFGAGAIYGILPCTEAQAREMLEQGYGFAHPSFAAKALPATASGTREPGGLEELDGHDDGGADPLDNEDQEGW